MRLAWLCLGSLGLTLVVTCGGEQPNNEDGSSVGDGGDSVGSGGTGIGAEGGRDESGGSDAGGASAGSSMGGSSGGASGGSSPTGGIAGESATGGIAGAGAVGGFSGSGTNGGAAGNVAGGSSGGNQPNGGVGGQGGASGAAGTVSTGGVAGTVSTGGVAGTVSNGGTSGAGGGSGGSGGGVPVRRSCVGATGNECRGESCCTTIAVPTQSFTLGGTVVTPTSAATVNAFELDKYQVTVARFRRFVSVYDGWRGIGNPAPGAGAHPLIANSGWQSSWNASLPASAAALVSAIKCDATYQTFTDTPGSKEEFPINCMNWFPAFAFCVWDGMRLATEAERESAGAGGSENRLYPWGSGAPNSSLGIYDNAPIVAVGSKPYGAGRWGHLDLAGPLFDWVMDVYAPYPSTCNNCAAVSTSTGGMRVLRGTGFNDSAMFLRASSRVSTFTTNNHFTLGIRCAKSP